MSQFGWVKDKYSPKDYLYRLPVRALPEKVDLSKYLPPIRNQGNVSSCVGFGIGGNLVSILKMQNAYSEWFSPTWIYNWARAMEGTLTQDIGCLPRDACDALLKYGCLLEHFWPYNNEKLDMSTPSSERMEQATKYVDFAYYRVVDGVDGIKAALADNHMVSIGCPWFTTWLNPTNGDLPEVTAENYVAGGHETCLYAYDDSTGRFYGINSWGKNWGMGGLFTMPYSAIGVFKALGGYDAHYFTFTVTGLNNKPGCLPIPGFIKNLIRR